MRSFAEQAGKAVVDAPLVAEGTPVVRFTTAWGQTVTASAGASVTEPRWVGAVPQVDPTLEPVGPAAAGTVVGSARIWSGERTVTAPLKLDERVNDPGVLWRLSHPIPVIAAFVDELQGR